jgi:hypothetical protein
VAAGSVPAVAHTGQPTKIKVIKSVYPDLHKRELNRQPVSWNHLREMAHARWDRTHPAAARAALIQDLIEQANAFPPGLKSANGSRWIPNGANYALFTVLVPGQDGICLREISGRETGGTYDHRVGYGFVYNNPYGVPAYGLPQANPPEKMAAEGADWATNPRTQIEWMNKYVQKYGGACPALSHHKSPHTGATY